VTKRKASKQRAKHKRKVSTAPALWPAWDDPRIKEPWDAYMRNKKEREHGT